MDTNEITRTCKTCEEIKPISQYDKTYNKACVNICYRRSCSKCVRGTRKEYLKKRHKEKYTPQKRAKKYIKHPKPVNHCPGCKCEKHIII